MSDLAQAYKDIEPDLRDLLRSIRIAALLARDPVIDDDDDLVAHAVCQAEKEAAALREKYYALYEGRAKV